MTDYREIAPCPRCKGAHLALVVHPHRTPLLTEAGPLDAWFECPRLRQQVACRTTDYPAATVENIRALLGRAA